MKGRVIVIGASQGGIEALSRLVTMLPAGFPAPVFIAQHVGAGSPGMLPQILSRGARLSAVHPTDTEIFQSGRIYVAPPDRHMLVQRGYIRLSQGPRENYVRPAIDPLFRSAAVAYGPAVVGVVLTGHLDDGTAGLMTVKDRGGIAMVQEPSEAIAPSMPRSAAAHVCIDHCCPVAEMGDILVNLANDDWAPPELDAHNELTQLENRIAEGTFDVADWLKFEELSVPCGLTCPECQSALFELRDERMVRFRCRAGHAFSARCLLEAQARLRENRLAAAFSSLTEEAALARRLLKTPEAESADIHAVLNGKIEKAEQEARRIWERLCTPSGFEPLPVTGAPFLPASGSRSG